MAFDLMRPRKGALTMGGIAAVAALAGCGQSGSAGDTNGGAGVEQGNSRSTAASVAPVKSTNSGKQESSASSAGNAGGKYTIGDKSGSGSATAKDPAELTDTELIRRVGTDAVRLTFARGTGTPDYEVGYTAKPLRFEGSGKPAGLQGGPALAVDLRNATDGDIAAGDVLIDPQRQSTVAQVKSLGAFEGHVKAGIGLIETGKEPFRVIAGENTLTIEFDYGPPEDA